MANSKNQKNKIMFVANTLLHHQSFNMFLAEQCARNGYQVIFVANTTERNSTPIPKQIKLIHWNLDRGNTKIFKEKQSYLDLKKILKKENPDIIHAFTIKANIYASIAGKDLSRTKIVNTVTGLGQTFIDKRFSTLFTRTLTKMIWYWSLNLSDLVFFINHDDARLFKKYVRQPKISIIYGHGINLGTYSKSSVSKNKVNRLQTILHVREKEFVVATIGRLIKQKGIIEFFLAAKILMKQYDNLRFIIVGLDDNQNPSKLSDKVLKDIKNAGINILRNRDDIREILSLVDIFVLASYREGLPQSIIEAQAMGVPIVTTDVPGCRERIKNNYNGFLVPQKNHLALAAAIKKLIDNPQKRKIFSDRSLKIISKLYDQEKITESILAIYKEILK